MRQRNIQTNHKAFQVLYGISQNPGYSNMEGWSIIREKYSYSSYTRDSNKKVALKCLYNSQESIDSLINEWASGNEKIDEFIQERQLKISNYDDYDDIVLNDSITITLMKLKRQVKMGLITVYSAYGKMAHYTKKIVYSSYTRDSI
ncbi:unnamed protein product [Rhizophagus irregularis]|nr:unnamed protein product [Rhizophagus irregularis]